MTPLQMLDVSQFNGKIDWTKVRADGVILRAGYRGYGSGTLVTDSRFSENLAGANGQGLPVGLYWVSQAVSAAEAQEEARFVLALAKQGSVTLPIYLDSEYSGESQAKGRGDVLTRAQRTNYGLAFCQAIQAGGYRAGLYCSSSWFTAMLDGSRFREAGFSIWIAQYSKTQPQVGGHHAWQYTGSGTAPGITGHVDRSEFYVNYLQTKTEDEEMTQEQWNTMYETKMQALRQQAGADWSKAARDYCVQAGIFQGTGSDSFQWKAPLTREELAMILYRLKQA